MNEERKPNLFYQQLEKAIDLQEERIAKQEQAELLDRQFKKAMIEMANQIEEMRYALQALSILRNIANDIEEMKFCATYLASLVEIQKALHRMEKRSYINEET